MLEYPGKQEEAAILRQPGARSRLVWRGAPAHHAQTESRLYFGDNLPTLLSLLGDPAVKGQVRLVYIDPPFATQMAYQSRAQRPAYDDTRVGADFLEFLRARLIVLRELLAPDGSLYLHLDEKMVFPAKLLLDEIFGSENYRNCITRKKCNPKNYTRKQYGNVVDYLLFYTRSANYLWNRPVEPWTPERAREYQYVEQETGRRYMRVPVHAPGTRRGATGAPWRGRPPPPGKHWQYAPAKLDELDAAGRIHWSARGNPRRKVYLDESAGIGVQDLWLDYKDAHNQNVAVTGYPTEKNVELLRRVVQASSRPGDWVLDCFCGSGTTLAVADDLGRRFIGMDDSPEALSTTLQRFAVGPAPLGDFVRSREPAPSLFTALAQPSAAEAESSTTGLTHFALHATAPLPEPARRAVAAWRRRWRGTGRATGWWRSELRRAQAHLSACDPHLRAIIERVGPCQLAPREPSFADLVDAIVSQQLSDAAAAAIRRRMRTLASEFSPDTLRRLEDAQLRAVGVSARKVGYLRSLAEHVQSGALNLLSLAQLSDEDVIARLCAVRGIGRWTAEMLLIFALFRLDVLPLGDQALRRVLGTLHGLPLTGGEDDIGVATEPWRPYRSVACWYLYRAV